MCLYSISLERVFQSVSQLNKDKTNDNDTLRHLSVQMGLPVWFQTVNTAD